MFHEASNVSSLAFRDRRSVLVSLERKLKEKNDMGNILRQVVLVIIGKWTDGSLEFHEASNVPSLAFSVRWNVLVSLERK